MRKPCSSDGHGGQAHVQEVSQWEDSSSEHCLPAAPSSILAGSYVGQVTDTGRRKSKLWEAEAGGLVLT